MEKSKTLEILNTLLSNNREHRAQGDYTGRMVYNNDLNTLLFEVENEVYDNYKIIFHPSGGETPSDIVSVFNSPYSEPYSFRLHYELDKFAEDSVSHINSISDIGQALFNPRSVFDCDLSDFNHFVSFLNGAKTSEFLKQVSIAVISIDDNDNNEYLDYLKDNGINLENFFQGTATKKDVEYNQVILQKFDKELFDSPDNILPKLKVIRDNIIAYMALSNVSIFKHELDELPIKNIQEIKEYIAENPKLMQSTSNKIINKSNNSNLNR